MFKSFLFQQSVDALKQILKRFYAAFMVLTSFYQKLLHLSWEWTSLVLLSLKFISWEIKHRYRKAYLWYLPLLYGLRRCSTLIFWTFPALSKKLTIKESVMSCCLPTNHCGPETKDNIRHRKLFSVVFSNLLSIDMFNMTLKSWAFQ